MVQSSDNSIRLTPEARKAKIAAAWLYAVALATLLNSLLLQLATRFIDLLLGLSFTQFIDAIFLGMRSVEPPGAPFWFEAIPALILDALFVLVVVMLAAKISRGSRRAAGASFFLYALDTAVFALSFGVSAGLRPHQALTLLVHAAGAVIIFRAWRALRRESPEVAPL